jgi:hypothetical protein
MQVDYMKSVLKVDKGQTHLRELSIHTAEHNKPTSTWLYPKWKF